MCERASMSLPSCTARQLFLDQPHALDRDAVGERMIERRAVRFETVRQRIHAGGRRDLRRQARP